MLRSTTIIGLFGVWLIFGLPRAQLQAEAPAATKNCVGKANKAKISADAMMPLRLPWSLFANWRDTGKWPDESRSELTNKFQPGVEACSAEKAPTSKCVVRAAVIHRESTRPSLNWSRMRALRIARAARYRRLKLSGELQ